MGLACETTFVLGSFVTVDYIFGALLISCTLVLNAELIEF